MSQEYFSWSVMKYDLKTGLDVLKLPCSVKLADDIFKDVQGERSSCGEHGCEILFEKKCCICFVRARVIDLPDIDWFIHKKGEEFVKYHAQLAGTDILIPLEYGGKVRMFDRSGGKEYLTVTKLIEDFPRYIKAADDMVCASPGDNKPQIVYKGTVLELDRITKNTGTYRGHRETFLICKDKENNRELAFRYMAAINFTKVPDTTKCVLKDFIEHLPLPQTVEFININPYDVISVDDDDARDLMVMLSGPVQLLGLHMENFVVGKVTSDDKSDCDNSIIAIPDADHVLETFNVRLPCDNRNSYKVRHKSKCTYVDVAVADDMLYDCLHQKLYLRFERDETPLVVCMNSSIASAYDNTDPPDTPPIPEKCEGRTLTPAFSMPMVNTDPMQERPKLSRKRFFSSNDIGRKNMSSNGESQRGLKTYMSHFSRRMKSTASQILFGLDAFSGTVNQDLAEGHKWALTYTETLPETPSTDGFICYVDYDIKQFNSDTSDPNTTHNDLRVSEISTGMDSNQQKTTTENPDDVIYAKVDKLKMSKHKNATNDQCHTCPVCRLTL